EGRNDDERDGVAGRAEGDGRTDADGRAGVELCGRAPVLGVDTVRTGGAGARLGVTVVVWARSANPGPLPATAKVERRSEAPTRPPPSALPNMSTLTVTRLPGAHLPTGRQSISRSERQATAPLVAGLALTRRERSTTDRSTIGLSNTTLITASVPTGAVASGVIFPPTCCPGASVLKRVVVWFSWPETAREAALST